VGLMSVSVRPPFSRVVAIDPSVRDLLARGCVFSGVEQSDSMNEGCVEGRSGNLRGEHVSNSDMSTPDQVGHTIQGTCDVPN
jgi:hypothetical protein